MTTICNKVHLTLTSHPNVSHWPKMSARLAVCAVRPAHSHAALWLVQRGPGTSCPHESLFCSLQPLVETKSFLKSKNKKPAFYVAQACLKLPIESLFILLLTPQRHRRHRAQEISSMLLL